jgi:hypothetical protein
MIIKQISIFIENKPGRLFEVTEIIAGNNINMRALMLAESTNSGILRIISDDPDKLEEVLKANEMRYAANFVLSVLVDDKTGGLADMLKELAGDKIAVRYMYAFAVGHKKACMILRTGEESRERAIEILKQAGYKGYKEPEDINI